MEKEAYLSVLSRYIHLNPIRLKKLEKAPETEKLEQLFTYPWSSLPGYLDKRRREGMIDYSLVLSDYGGDTENGRSAYRKQLIADVSERLDVKEDVFGQSILGGSDFIKWVKETFLEEIESREQPAAGEIKRYQQKVQILALIEQETGKDLDTLCKEKGELRRLAMDLLYRRGGLRGPEIGALLGVDYSAVSQERKRLRERIARDHKLKEMMRRLEELLSTVKI